jgi:flagellar hook protein FlgE
MGQGLYTAVSGIRANQTKMDVLSNNIANVNTLGFKSSSANFATVYASTISGGSSPNGTSGGTNPKQLGNGALVSEIASDFGQGGTQFTGRSTDVMINGNGFFAVERVDVNNPTNTTNYSLTRAGNFTLDSGGNLVTSTGSRLLGSSQVSGSSVGTEGRVQLPTQFLATKSIDTASGKTLNILYSPIGTSQSQIATDFAAKFGALPAGATLSDPVNTQLTSFSIQPDGAITASYSNGDKISVRTDAASQAAANLAGDPSLVRRELVTTSGTASFAAENVTGTDGGGMGQVAGREVFTGGLASTPTGYDPMQGMQFQLQTASVTNPNGLLYAGDSNFLQGANSGETQFGIAGTGSRGSLTAGSLESSNVDLAGQFTDMIVAQRGLEAASKMVKAQSEVLQTIINIV